LYVQALYCISYWLYTRYRKAVKEKNLPAQKRLILMAAKELTDKQIEHLPDTIKCEIMAKVANLEKRENL